MEKFPFTTQGAAQLISTLYALDQPALQLEADAAGTDFRAWIIAHFNLENSQTDYLNAIDATWIQNAAVNTQAFLELRKPILLQKAQPPSSPLDEEGDRGKLLDLEKRQHSTYSTGHGLQENETLIFSISYSN